jgi:hypothetical protein
VERLDRLNPEKLFVEFRQGVTPTEPIIPRRYTLTHSDLTAELFLTIGQEYAVDKITAMRDEVLAEWKKQNNQYVFPVHLDVDGQSTLDRAAIRNAVFRRELSLALEAIRYGDRRFFVAHPNLDQVPIFIYFHSAIPQFNVVENWDTFADYK